MSDHEHGEDRSAGAAGEHDPERIHEPIYRELAEPRDGHEPTPMWLVFAAMALLGWGGYYLGTFSGGFRADVYAERAGQAPAAAQAEPVAADPLVLGRRVYNTCMACHQRDGQGVAGAYPPLAGSARVAGSPELLARIVLHGLAGELRVGEQVIDNVMPGWPRLSDEEIAAVLTYVRASFGNQAGAVAPELVAAVRTATADRRQPWQVAELDRLAAEAGGLTQTERAGR